MGDYIVSDDPWTNAPWVDKRLKFKHVIIEYGVKNISAAAFLYWGKENYNNVYENIINVRIGNTVTSITTES